MRTFFITTVLRTGFCPLASGRAGRGTFSADGKRTRLHAYRESAESDDCGPAWVDVSVRHCAFAEGSSAEGTRRHRDVASARIGHYGLREDTCCHGYDV